MLIEPFADLLVEACDRDNLLGELGDELCSDGLGAEHGALRVGRADGLRATFVLPRQPRFFNHAANLVTPIRRIASGVW